MHIKKELLSTSREQHNLLITVLINVFISLVELIGGLLSNSLALISDALHNFSDGLALFITYITLKISKKNANPKNTFGYKRIQILAALFNAVTLIAICIYLIFEAWERMINPQEVKGFSMLVVAGIGLVANIVGVILLKDFSSANLNIKAAYLHLIGDTLSSVAVIIGGILIYFYNIFWIDPVITLLISIYIIRETWQVLNETYNILMQASPANLDVKTIRDRLMEVAGVKNIHHVHIWQLTDQEIHFEGHIELEEDLLLSKVQKIQEKINKILIKDFLINHITLQSEYRRCDNAELISGNKC
ncbi:MAG: cation transporter [Bacteroidetes bacterium HGW-Bacteroidetes-1]|jgi:cobalt-zinc-cadmium efflux system protein|nr:MAG: cation transporter [Bacteroidetes bacterium HGW-Bacteroidetes-1]